MEARAAITLRLRVAVPEVHQVLLMVGRVLRVVAAAADTVRTLAVALAQEVRAVLVQNGIPPTVQVAEEVEQVVVLLHQAAVMAVCTAAVVGVQLVGWQVTVPRASLLLDTLPAVQVVFLQDFCVASMT